jgi:hypothetical protein
MLLLLAAAANASVLVGGAWTPAGVGGLALYASDGFSGTLAGEFDGLLRPPLTAHGGWVGKQDAILGNAALVQITTARFADTTAVDAVGGVRLGLDYRRYVFARAAGAANLYATVGGFGVLPNAADTDTAYTADEQADADDSAAADRARIGGFGGQGGIGAEYVFGDKQDQPAVALGVRWLVRGFRGQEIEDGAARVSTLVASEAALVLEFTR